MKIGVVGVGMVGTAVLRYFQGAHGIEAVGYDKYKAPYQDPNVLTDCDIVFVCVPTPTINRHQDLLALYETMVLLKAIDTHAEIVIKSTILPGTCKKLWSTYGLDVIHNPEFLTEAKALEDFVNQEQIIIGHDTDSTPKVIELYEKHFHGAEIVETSTQTAELYKYAHNCFLATKVTFWNEIYHAANRCKANFELVRDLLVDTGKAGKTHNQVPGPDGQFGYGGACFPKDMAAFGEWSGHNLIAAANAINLRVRK